MAAATATPTARKKSAWDTFVDYGQAVFGGLLLLLVVGGGAIFLGFIIWGFIDANRHPPV